MKTKDIAKNYDIDNAAFDNWLYQSGYNYRITMTGLVDVDESQNIDGIVDDFEHATSPEVIAEQQRGTQQMQQATANMLITSGFSFDGYTITKYSGYISGDDAVNIDRGMGSMSNNVADSLMNSLVNIRRNALAELKEASYALGCNAVIGVDFDYLTLDPETAGSNGGTLYLPYVFGVTANGNAVIIEKNERI